METTNQHQTMQQTYRVQVPMPDYIPHPEGAPTHVWVERKLPDYIPHPAPPKGRSSSQLSMFKGADVSELSVNPFTTTTMAQASTPASSMPSNQGESHVGIIIAVILCILPLIIILRRYA